MRIFNTGKIKNMAPRKCLEKNWFLIYCSTVRLKKITMLCLMMLYCFICESNEIFGGEDHWLLKWIFWEEGKEMASESNNYTFETYKILLTIFIYRKSRICVFQKLLMFPFISIMENGKKLYLFAHRNGKELLRRAVYPKQIFPDSFFPWSSLFIWET